MIREGQEVLYVYSKGYRSVEEYLCPVTRVGRSYFDIKVHGTTLTFHLAEAVHIGAVPGQHREKSDYSRGWVYEKPELYHSHVRKDRDISLIRGFFTSGHRDYDWMTEEEVAQVLFIIEAAEQRKQEGSK